MSATTAQPPRTRLAQARTERGWTKSRLIHQLRVQAGERVLPGDESLNRMIAGWENQGRPISDYYQGLLSRAYSSTPDALGISPEPRLIDGHGGLPEWAVQVSHEGWDEGGYTHPGAPAGVVVREWSGAEAHALQRALRLTNMGFAEKLGLGMRTVAKWRGDPQATLSTISQDVLDTALRQASAEERQRFLQITRPDQAQSPLTPVPLTATATTPLTATATTTATATATASGDAAPVETSDSSTQTALPATRLRDETCDGIAACDETPPSDAVEAARLAVEQLAASVAARQRAAQAARQAIEDERQHYHQRQHTDEHSTDDTHEMVMEAA